MRIAIDARAYFQRTGIARYTRGLVQALVEGNRRDDLLLLISDRHRPGEVPLRHPRVDVRVSRAPWLGGSEERAQLSREVRAWRADLFHSVFPPLTVDGCASVVTVFDLTPISHPQFHQAVVTRAFRQAVRHALPRASRLLPISQAVGDELSRRFPETADRVRTVGTGLSADFDHVAAGDVRRGVLFAGTIEPRKNVRAVVETARELGRREDPTPVTIAGKPGWGGYDVAAEIRGLPHARYLGYVTDGRLRALYRGAAIFLYPSAVEGFGLPVLEAMAQGALPLISPDPALLDVVGDPALVVNPDDPQQIADAVVRWSTQETARLRRTGRLAHRARRFTWRRVAQNVTRVYRELA
jgi:alpha-1,3-rhamnosyl/mannosyltransferase